MPYYRRRNAMLSGSAWPVGAALGAVVILFFAVRVFAPDALAGIASPFWHAGSALTKGAAAVTLPFADTAKLKVERDQLAAENAALVAQNMALAAQVRDTSALGSGIAAGVLSRPPVSPYDTLILGAGSDDGVRADAFVHAAGGTPVGIIEMVSPHTSRVLLYSTAGRTTEGWVGESRLPISLVGRGAGAFEATLPRENEVQVGAVVYLPGPGALPVGTVVKIDSDPSSPRSVVHVKPLVNPFSITWVTVAP